MPYSVYGPASKPRPDQPGHQSMPALCGQVEKAPRAVAALLAGFCGCASETAPRAVQQAVSRSLASAAAHGALVAESKTAERPGGWLAGWQARAESSLALALQHGMQ